MVSKRKIGIVVLVTMFLFNVASVFAIDVKVGKYIAGDSRNDLDPDYWILLNSNHTAGIHAPGGSANGTWSYDGQYISIKINSASGELSDLRGETFTLQHADATGTVLYDGEDAYWLQ